MLSLVPYINVITNAEREKLSLGEAHSFVPMWVSYLREEIKLLKKRQLLSLYTYNICDKILETWEQPYIHNNKLTITQINFLYQYCIGFIFDSIQLNAKKLAIPQGYPFSKNISGVLLQVRLIMDENTICCQTTTNSGVGSKEKNINYTKAIADLSWLKKIINPLSIKIPAKAHAETVWFAKHSEDLIQHLIENPLFSRLAPLPDEFPIMQLAQTPRLEIVTSSTCCETYCQPMFKQLRLYLVSLNINLPIVFYADQIFNNKEQTGSVHVLTTTGIFHDTSIQCNTPHVAQHPIPGMIAFPLKDKLRQDFSNLAQLGALTLRDLIAVAISNGDMSRPYLCLFTYLSPDAFIIFVADLHLYEPTSKASIKFRNKLTAMIDRLENIDFSLLTFWRVAFLEQLHWLIISHFYPRYQESAHKRNFHYNRLFFTHEIENSISDFCSDFLTLWRKINLEKTYPKMLDHFIEDSYQRMPLGSIVGPLTFNQRNTFFNPNNMVNNSKITKTADLSIGLLIK